MNTHAEKMIEDRARAMKAAGCSWPSVQEFTLLYGQKPTSQDLEDYLSVFDPAKSPKFQPEA